MKYTIIFSLTIIVISSVWSELIEYYPSKASLHSIGTKIINKNEISKRQVEDDDGLKSKEQNILKLRYFNREKMEKKSKRDTTLVKRAVDSVFRGHRKTREELWNERFLHPMTDIDQSQSLIKLVHNITMTYLTECTPVILYDYQIKEKESYLFQNLLKDFPVTYVHGYINDKYKLVEPDLLKPVQECIHYIVFITEVKKTALVLGKQSNCKVIVIPRSSQWSVQEFLGAPESRNFINLLIIGQSFVENADNALETPYILYTHRLFVDGLGGSKPVVLTSWSHGKYSRNVDLFPAKMTRGYAGHRFVIAAANQPPFVIRRIVTDADGGNPRVTWDGIEIRLLKYLAEINNFSMEIQDAKELSLGPGDAVGKDIAMGRADIGVAGMYMSNDRAREMDLTFAHSKDCAAFITLMSTALPRYRAILGPFHWHVWVALIFTYMIGILPLAFSDKHTLRHLIDNFGEIENMFWYVFGTFTNCFTFLGKNSWSKTEKITTRLLIGWYWLFTIIITSCYTGSIIAFVTLPIFPETVDTVEQLLKGYYRVGTLDRGGWERWFFNSSDSLTNKLMKKLELVPNIEAGIRNTTKAFFWPYAFLGSQAELEYLVQANFSITKSKRAMLHISNECFVPFGVIMGFPNNSLYTDKLSRDVMRMKQSGLIDKIADEVRWDIQKTATGNRLAVTSGTSFKITSVEEKGLTLEDTQGMFLLLGAGFLLATTALLSEWMGGFTRRCRQLRQRIRVPSSISRDNLISTLPTEERPSEVHVTNDGTDSKLDFRTRSSSLESRDTLEGQIINVTAESIIVHDNIDADDWDVSRRSSSVDIDKEVKEIFERDQNMNKKLTMPEDVIDLEDEDRKDCVSKGAFGAHLK